jgi:transposase-like protein
MTKAVRDPLYLPHRFPAEVIAHAVWLYLRFPLSLRMVEDHLVAWVADFGENVRPVIFMGACDAA